MALTFWVKVFYVSLSIAGASSPSPLLILGDKKQQSNKPHESSFRRGLTPQKWYLQRGKKSHEMTVYKGFQMVGFTHNFSAHKGNRHRSSPHPGLS